MQRNTGNMSKSSYDTDEDGVVDKAEGVRVVTDYPESPSAASSAIEPVSYVLYTDGTDVFIRDRTGALITSAGIVFGLTADSNGRDTEWCSGLVIYNSNNNVINCGAFFDREASPTQEWGVHLTGTSTGNKTIYGSYSGNAGSAYYDESSGSNTHVT